MFHRALERAPGEREDFQREACGGDQELRREVEFLLELDEQLLVASGPDRDLVSLDDALQALAAVDERKVRVVEMRFFGGLSVEETAEAP